MTNEEKKAELRKINRRARRASVLMSDRIIRGMDRQEALDLFLQEQYEIQKSLLWLTNPAEAHRRAKEAEDKYYRLRQSKD